MIPNGFERARRATAIASKPTVVPKLLVIVWVTPRTTMVPARPARSPHNDIVRTISVRGRIPAYRAASGFAPTVRISNPSVVRNSSHDDDRGHRERDEDPEVAGVADEDRQRRVADVVGDRRGRARRPSAVR